MSVAQPERQHKNNFDTKSSPPQRQRLSWRKENLWQDVPRALEHEVPPQIHPKEAQELVAQPQNCPANSVSAGWRHRPSAALASSQETGGQAS